MKRITLWIKTKRKIHNNVGEKEHSTRCHHQHSSYVNLPQISSPPTTTICLTHFYIIITWAHDTKSKLAIFVIESVDRKKNVMFRTLRLVIGDILCVLI